MKPVLKTIPLLSLAVTLSVAAITAPALANNLDKKAVRAIHIALDDEYKAASLYQGVLGKFGNQRPFSNIIRAERHHIGMLITLLKTYNQKIPANPYQNGSKARPAIPSSILSACKKSITAEIDNIALYNNRIIPAVSTYPDVRNIMIQLRNASEQRHLQAFKRCVARGGKVGRGGGMGMGHGRGMGMGRGHGQGRGMH